MQNNIIAVSAAIFFLLLPFIFHLIATGTLISGLWIYFIGAIIAAVFMFQEIT